MSPLGAKATVFAWASRYGAPGGGGQDQSSVSRAPPLRARKWSNIGQNRGATPGALRDRDDGWVFVATWPIEARALSSSACGQRHDRHSVRNPQSAVLRFAASIPVCDDGRGIAGPASSSWARSFSSSGPWLCQSAQTVEVGLGIAHGRFDAAMTQQVADLRQVGPASIQRGCETVTQSMGTGPR